MKQTLILNLKILKIIKKIKFFFVILFWKDVVLIKKQVCCKICKGDFIIRKFRKLSKFLKFRLQPVFIKDKIKDNIYDCPLYKTISRNGDFGNNGQSNNFITTISLNTD